MVWVRAAFQYGHTQVKEASRDRPGVSKTHQETERQNRSVLDLFLTPGSAELTLF
jgi:hypothetical protein